MNHYLITRAYRSPEYPIEANRRRIEITRRVTALSLSRQGTEWTWLVYIDPADPLLEERLDAFRSAGAPVVPVPMTDPVEDYIDWSDAVLTTRVDDDDAFARDAFPRLHNVIGPRTQRKVFMFPSGHRVNAGKVEPIHHLRNAWSSLYCPQGDRGHIRQKAHPLVRLLGPIKAVDSRPAWLWVRHQDAETGFRRAAEPITDNVRALYDVDWEFVEELP